MDSLLPEDRLETIGRPECLRLLGTGHIGRLGFLVDGRPRIEPVNYSLVGEAVVLLSRPGAKLDAAMRGATVAFEVDHVEEWARAGWSVLVSGTATVVDPGDVDLPRGMLPRPWVPADGSLFIRIEPEEITGRRVRAGAGGVSIVDADTLTS